MMMVKVEAREFKLTNRLDELKALNLKIRNHAIGGDVASEEKGEMHHTLLLFLPQKGRIIISQRGDNRQDRCRQYQSENKMSWEI